MDEAQRSQEYEYSNLEVTQPGLEFDYGSNAPQVVRGRNSIAPQVCLRVTMSKGVELNKSDGSKLCSPSSL